MHYNLHATGLVVRPHRHGGVLAVRTGLRGGVCVEVNDQVKSALQTLTDALAGTTTTAADPATTSVPATTSS
jgi:hypothetical protein